MAKAAAKTPSTKSGGNIRYELTGLTILDLDVDVDYDSESATELFYSALISTPRKIDDSKYAFISLMNAGNSRPESDESSTYVQAKYGAIIVIDTKDQKKVIEAAKECARTSLWGRFAVWYLATVAQLPINLPGLPTSPEWLI